MQIETEARRYVRQQEDSSQPIDTRFLRDLTGWKPPAINLLVQGAMREETAKEQLQRLRGAKTAKTGRKQGQATLPVFK